MTWTASLGTYEIYRKLVAIAGDGRLVERALREAGPRLEDIVEYIVDRRHPERRLRGTP